MKSFATASIAVAVLAGSAAANPAPISPRAGLTNLKSYLCGPINLIINELIKTPAQKAQASGFCSSYIASTTKVTSTSTALVSTTLIATAPQTAVVYTTETAPTPIATAIAYSNCGIAGYDNGKSPTIYYDGSGANANFAACSAKCQENAQCTSFAFGGGLCLLYSVPQSTVVNPVATSPYTFFDRNCPDPASGAVVTPGASYAVPVASGVIAPTTTVALKRAVSSPIPAILANRARNIIVPACQCLITAASTVSITVAKTITSQVTILATTQPIVATNVITSVFTPAPATVTVTTTA